jgi:16S rRNA (guanine966-N2)-methyltransferase
MRVISGSARGRTLKTVKSREVRPTSDRVKESLFNVLAPRVGDALFLDLFAGSGGVGIEALSRGARSCVFVDLSTVHLQMVAENLRNTGLFDQAELIRLEARAAITLLGRRESQFDLIFVDPPYAEGLVAKSLQEIVTNGILVSTGWVVCEHHKKDLVPDAVTASPEAGGLSRFREIHFGDTVLSLYRREAQNA